MKQRLLFSTFIVCAFISFSAFSQYKPDEQRMYSWDDTSSDWEHTATMEYTYGNEGDKETNLLSLVMPGSQKQIQYHKQYNASNMITTQITQFWEPSLMVWQDFSKTDYEYDGSNNLVIKTDQTYNFGTMVYTNSVRTMYVYTGANLSSETKQFWNAGSGTWVNDSRELYEYSGTDMSQQTDQEWNAGTSNWVNREQTEITYGSPGYPSQTIIKEWNLGTSIWEFDERIDYTYQTNRISEALGYDYIGGTWVLDFRTVFTYVNNLATEILYQERDGTEWVNVDRVLNTYDANGNNIVMIAEDWDTTDMAWEPVHKIETDYSLVLPFSLSTDDFKKEQFVVYPNPATDIINITYFQPIEKMELFDVSGKKLMSSYNVSQLNVESLKSGMYVLKVYDKSSSSTKRIMVK